jgi:signal peptidase I
MSEVNIDSRHRRTPATAVVLSLIMPGLGHIYVGRFVRGLVLVFLDGILIPATIVIFSVNPLSSGLAVLIASLMVISAITIFAVVDSYRLARHTKAGYELKEYNRWYVYLMLIVLGTSSSIEIALHVREKYIEAFVVPAGSMYPTIVPGDRILANKIAYDKAAYQRGDVVVFIAPDKPRIKYIKRLVALPGDTVEIKNSDIYVNDQKFQREALPEWTLSPIEAKYPDGLLKGQLIHGEVFYEDNGQIKYKILLSPDPSPELVDMEKITVPKHHCFVLGDNRHQSYDSRQFGPVPLATIVGRADYLYFPTKDFSRIGKIND